MSKRGTTTAEVRGMRPRLRSWLAPGSGLAVAVLIGATLSMGSSGVFRPAVINPPGQSSVPDSSATHTSAQTTLRGLLSKADMGSYPIEAEEVTAEDTATPADPAAESDDRSPSRGGDRIEALGAN